MPIIKACPKLEKLCIPDFSDATDKTLACLSLLSHLKELDLSDSRYLNYDAIVDLIKASPDLEVLRIPQIDDDAVLECLGRYCSRFRIIETYGGYLDLSDAAVIALARGCPLLEDMRLADYQPTDEVLAVLAVSCHNLKRVELGDYTPLCTDQGLLALARGCPMLTQLHLNNNAVVTDAGILGLAEHCHMLESVSIAGTILITSASLCPLFTSSPRVISIRLDQCDSVTDEVLVAISQHCPKLATLDINNCKLLTGVVPLLDIASHCILLERLQLLGYSTLTDAAVEAFIRHCKRLKHILLYECPNITSHSLKALLEYGKSLISLKICKCKLHASDVLSNYYTVEDYPPRQPGQPDALKAVLYRKNTRIPWKPPTRD